MPAPDQPGQHPHPHPHPYAECRLPGCHGPVQGRGQRYCCPEHSRTARNLANARDKAAAAEREALRAALDPQADRTPLRHEGFLVTADAVVLSGQALVELRAAVGALRSAAAAADGRDTAALDRVRFLARLRAVRQAAEQAAAAIERVLPPP